MQELIIRITEHLDGPKEANIQTTTGTVRAKIDFVPHAIKKFRLSLYHTNGMPDIFRKGTYTSFQAALNMATRRSIN